MTFAKSDIPHIKLELLVFLVALALAGGLIWWGGNSVTQAEANQQALQKRLVEARSQLNTARSDLDNMQVYALEYDVLLKQKVIGEDQRLDWLEEMTKLRKQNVVLDFKYGIAPQLPYTPAPALDSGNYQLSLSGMTLQFDLLHEAQLINFFDTLRSDMKGWFMLDHCSLERSNVNGVAPEAAPNNAPSGATRPVVIAPRLRAECTGGWLTLQHKGAK